MSFLATDKPTETSEPYRIELGHGEVNLLEVKRNSRFGLRLHLLKYRSDNKPFLVLRLKIRFQQPFCGRKTTFLVR